MELLLSAVILAFLIFLLVEVRRRRAADTSMESTVRMLSTSMGDMGALKSQVETLSASQTSMQQAMSSLQSAVQTVETRVVESTGSVKETLLGDLARAKSVLDTLRAQYEERKRVDDELQHVTRRIEGVIVGSRSRGAAGEHILEEAFKQFPPGMIETNFKVGGKPVEYALILANKKRLAIDSKWPAADLLEQLAQETDADRQAAIVEEIERLLARKAREVAQYIDPAATLPWAVAAVPDAAFGACRQAHIQAFRDRVILMPYSMTIPFVLALYNLHLQYASSVDVERLEDYLQQMERNLEGLERALENSIARGATMVNNAYSECKRIVGEMRGAVAYLRALPGSQAAAEVQGLPTAPDAIQEGIVADSGPGSGDH